MTYRLLGDDETACDAGCCLIGIDDEIRPRHEAWQTFDMMVDDETIRPMFEILDDISDVDVGDTADISPTTEAARAQFVTAVDEAFFALLRAGPHEVGKALQRFHLVWYDRQCILAKDSRED